VLNYFHPFFGIFAFLWSSNFLLQPRF
jgi:hypothetical protein